jgi:4-hydroxyphenylpyruvate dioxygenase-like putative hemolysin
MQELASRRRRDTRPISMPLDHTPESSAPAEDGQVVALTLVVADLVAASAAWSARLGATARAVEPEHLDEPGLAQGFDLGPCRLLLLEPSDDSDAGDFLRDHGPGLYAIALRDGRRLSPEPGTSFDLLAPLPLALASHSLN